MKKIEYRKSADRKDIDWEGIGIITIFFMYLSFVLILAYLNS